MACAYALTGTDAIADTHGIESRPFARLISAWTVIFHVGPLRRAPVRHPDGPPRTAAAWVLIATGALFAGLWLSELVPALITGEVPASLTEAGLRVNPIHVIDLSMVLPGFILSGVAAMRNRQQGLF